MTSEQLFSQIRSKRSFLCVGLDTDVNKIPRHLLSQDDPVFAFNRAIVDATAPYAVCYKPNMAFYEESGAKGWESFRRTVEYIRERYPDMLIIADAKRGDIGNTSKMYARAFFSENLADAVTVSPYMGYDTVGPFLQYEGKWAVVLALTSNPSAADFELQRMEDGGYLYEKVIDTACGWGTTDNLMFVVGATQAKMLRGIRRLIPNHFLLVPGVGAQGGSLEEVARYGMNGRCGLLVNSSRGIIYADSTERFAEAAACREIGRTGRRDGRLARLVSEIGVAEYDRLRKSAGIAEYRFSLPGRKFVPLHARTELTGRSRDRNSIMACRMSGTPLPYVFFKARTERDAGSAAAGRTESAEISGTIRIKRGLSLCDPEYPKSGKQAFFLYVFAGNRYHVFD